MHPPKPAALIERRVVKVLCIDTEVASNVLGDLLEPPPLLVGESLAGRLLLRHPCLEVRGNTFRIRHQLVLLMHRKTHQRYQIGEDAPTVCSLDLALIESSVGLPELAFVPKLGRSLQRVS